MEKIVFSDGTFVFDYTAYIDNPDYDDYNAPDYNGGVMVTVAAKELAAIVELFESNDGHACRFEDLPLKLQGRVLDAAMDDFAVNGKVFPGLDEACYDFRVDSNLPQELIHEIEKVVDHKGMTVEFSVSADGKIHQDKICIRISVDDFYRFAAIQDELHDGYSDFDWLNERAGDIYERIFELVNECGEKWWMAHGGKIIQPALLTDCPVELWTYLYGDDFE